MTPDQRLLLIALGGADVAAPVRGAVNAPTSAEAAAALDGPSPSSIGSSTTSVRS